MRSFHLSASELHDGCSVSISVEVIRFEYLQQESYENSTLGYFCKSMNSQMHRRFQPLWLSGRWLLCSVIQVEISHPSMRHIFYSPESSNIYGESDFFEE